MAKRGRISGAELSVVVDLSRRPPPPPPSDLPPSQAETWRTVMGSVPSDYISRGAYPVLIELCRHIDRGRMLEGLIASFAREWIGEDGGIERLDKLLQAAEREGRAILACCRSLRLTPQSVHPTTSARRLANHLPAGRRPPWAGAVRAAP
jgi:hypothetical protein